MNVLIRKAKMNIKMLKLALVGLILSVSGFANAGLITIGSLSSNDDGSTQIINDSLNEREWLRWDVLADLNYTQTLAATTSGAYSDWTIATENDAIMFMTALTGLTKTFATPTSFTDYNTDYSGTSYSSEQLTSLVGDSYFRGNTQSNVAWFHHTDDLTNPPTSSPYIWLNSTNSMHLNSCSTSCDSDYASNSSSSIPWLMYKTTEVPEPSTLAIFALGIMGLASRRFKKQ